MSHVLDAKIDAKNHENLRNNHEKNKEKMEPAQFCSKMPIIFEGFPIWVPFWARQATQERPLGSPGRLLVALGRSWAVQKTRKNHPEVVPEASCGRLGLLEAFLGIFWVHF